MPLFDVPEMEKAQLYEKWIRDLSIYHAERCPEYKCLLDHFGSGFAVPVRLFKEFNMRSVAESDVQKTMTSSGTTSQAKSKIYLDRDTSTRQAKALTRIVGEFIGTKKRLPMLVIDAPGTVKNRLMFSARTAGIRGFSMMGRDVTFALDDDMDLDWESLKAFSEQHVGEQVLLFGFTFMIWQYFVRALEKSGKTLSLSGTLVHGGGWKKLISEAVSREEFNRRVSTASGVERVCDYYGMVEQAGSIAMECECGHLHVSLLSDVDMVDPYTFEVVPVGERGLIKSISLLPTSYPGHVLLTEDEGIVRGVDDCPCGRGGKYFQVLGRLPGAELRGCSDTYERY